MGFGFWPEQDRFAFVPVLAPAVGQTWIETVCTSCCTYWGWAHGCHIGTDQPSAVMLNLAVLAHEFQPRQLLEEPSAGSLLWTGKLKTDNDKGI